VAKVNLVADGRSGTARVTGRIGGGVIPTPSGTGPTPTPTPSTNSAPGALTGGATTADAGAAASSAGATSTATESTFVDVTIGSANPTTVVISADPMNIASSAPRYSTLRAAVFDKDGNPVPRVPVIFRITKDADFSESLESGGTPIYTDNNGQANDRIFTAVARDAPAQTVEVTAVVITSGELAAKTPVIVGINY
jgi:hypothetical protein